MLDKPQEIGLRYSIFDTAGVYGHKIALKANYNKASPPHHRDTRPTALCQVRQVLSLHTLSHLRPRRQDCRPLQVATTPSHKKRIAVGDAPTAIRSSIRSGGPKTLLQPDYLSSAFKALVMASSTLSTSVTPNPSEVAVATNSPVSADTNWMVTSFNVTLRPLP